MWNSNFPRLLHFYIIPVLDGGKWTFDLCVMFSKPFRLAFAVVSSLNTIIVAAGGSSCEWSPGTLPDLNAAANNSYFVKWRPSFHCQAPNSWQNGTHLIVGGVDT